MPEKDHPGCKVLREVLEVVFLPGGYKQYVAGAHPVRTLRGNQSTLSPNYHVKLILSMRSLVIGTLWSNVLQRS